MSARFAQPDPTRECPSCGGVGNDPDYGVCPTCDGQTRVSAAQWRSLAPCGEQAQPENAQRSSPKGADAVTAESRQAPHSDLRTRTTDREER